jgi:hypothetical protein
MNIKCSRTITSNITQWVATHLQLVRNVLQHRTWQHIHGILTTSVCGRSAL